MLPSLTICGVVRNSAQHLSDSIEMIEKICNESQCGDTIVVTNDNEDDTANILTKWSMSNRDVQLIVCDGVINVLPMRVDRLAFARNLYLSALRNRTRKVELLIVVDLDGLNAKITPSDLTRAVETAPSDWIAIFANQTGAYYDVYALRRERWVDSDVWNDIEASTAWTHSIAFRSIDRLLHGQLRRKIMAMYIQKLVHEKQYQIPYSSQFIAVNSAFGGLGIYRYVETLSAWYSSRDEIGRVTCEHVSFHRQIAMRGGGLYICPSLRNMTPKEHVGAGSGRPFPAELLGTNMLYPE